MTLLAFMNFIKNLAYLTAVYSVLVHNLGPTAKQVVMVWACAAKRRQ